MVEQRTHKPRAGGSIPSTATKFNHPGKKIARSCFVSCSNIFKLSLDLLLYVVLMARILLFNGAWYYRVNFLFFPKFFDNSPFVHFA